MKSRRILLTMVEPPLPFGNAVGRWYYVLLRGLVERGHQVRAFATCRTQEEADAAEDLFRAPEYRLRCYPYRERTGLRSKLDTLRRPHSYMLSPQLHADLGDALAEGFDVLHLEALWAGWAGLGHTERAVLNAHYLFEIDLAERPPASAYDRARRIRTVQAEHQLLRRYPAICTVSDRLSERVRQIAPGARVDTIPLGMDLSLYPFLDGGGDGAEPPTLGLIGSFGWQPTYSAAQRLVTRLWPAIRERVPEARLRLVGRRAREAMQEFLDVPGLSVHEDVPDTIPYFRSTDVMLYAPVAGSGMKVKTLEAFALGTPVVTTTEGVEGIPAVDGVHAGVCDDDAGLIERTVALLRDPGLRSERRRAARGLVEAHCAAAVVLDAWEEMHERVAGARGAALSAVAG